MERARQQAVDTLRAQKMKHNGWVGCLLVMENGGRTDGRGGDAEISNGNAPGSKVGRVVAAFTTKFALNSSISTMIIN